MLFSLGAMCEEFLDWLPGVTIHRLGVLVRSLVVVDAAKEGVGE